jgi:hypothetical protein
MKLRYLTAAALVLAASSTARALDIPGADGSDNAFIPTSNVEIDLGAADKAVWNAANPNPGEGVYDVDKWAIVFRYSKVEIPEDVTVTFKNHPSRAPVVWLVSGDVTIRGKVLLNSRDVGAKMLEPGPGGFRGGISDQGQSSHGFGPGGTTQAGSYATGGRGDAGNTYGNAQIIPLIGGSGGTAGNPGQRGGAGGGAILIAAAGVVSLPGTIEANTVQNEYWEGSGGSVRIVAEQLTGSGRISALCLPNPTLGYGRIRLETKSFDNLLSLTPLTQPVAPDSPVLLWPKSDAPTARIVSVVGLATPADPRVGLGSKGGGNADLTLDGPGNGAVVIETTNLPETANVVLRIVGLGSGRVDKKATFVTSTGNKSTWRVDTLPFHAGYCAMQVVARAQ